MSDLLLCPRIQTLYKLPVHPHIGFNCLLQSSSLSSYWCKPISLTLCAPGWNLNWHFMSEGVSHCECWLFSPFPTLFNHRFPVTAARWQKCFMEMFFLKCAWYEDYSLHTSSKVECSLCFWSDPCWRIPWKQPTQMWSNQTAQPTALLPSNT